MASQSHQTSLAIPRDEPLEEKLSRPHPVELKRRTSSSSSQHGGCPLSTSTPDESGSIPHVDIRSAVRHTPSGALAIEAGHLTPMEHFLQHKEDRIMGAFLLSQAFSTFHRLTPEPVAAFSATQRDTSNISTRSESTTSAASTQGTAKSLMEETRGLHLSISGGMSGSWDDCLSGIGSQFASSSPITNDCSGMVMEEDAVIMA
ncbi:Uu.00g053950.m01.CDS01 [Anthostomella pinea]|uniref:Uu.00g053950.m01.CDS01 n=1 Tax=Anthostomella pinea TaxID=933095 RepID=A0AAI8YPM1_9PEZI|nr:Uu.00g053950.m01.CDS01 [Anthostomella pinea]